MRNCKLMWMVTLDHINCFQWPQVYCKEFEYAVCIHQSECHPSPDPLSWTSYCPSLNDFEPLSHTAFLPYGPTEVGESAGSGLVALDHHHTVWGLEKNMWEQEGLCHLPFQGDQSWSYGPSQPPSHLLWCHCICGSSPMLFFGHHGIPGLCPLCPSSCQPPSFRFPPHPLVLDGLFYHRHQSVWWALPLGCASMVDLA